MKKILFLILLFFIFIPVSDSKEMSQDAQEQKPKEIQFIYINGSNNNDKKMTDWFFNGIHKMHPKMYKSFMNSDFIQEKLLDSGVYTISKEPQFYFWGDKSLNQIQSLDDDLSITKLFSPKIAQTVRKLLAHYLHDALWVSHYRNMHPIINELHEQVKDNYKNNKSVILLGYSAGSFITYEYLFNKLPNLDLYAYIKDKDVSDTFKTYVKNNKKNPTCIDALVDSKLAVFSADNKLVPNTDEKYAKQAYETLDKYTCSSCIPTGAVRGIINFASPLVLFYSDISDPAYPLTYNNKLLYKYMLENDLFWLTVNYADDPLGYPTSHNISYNDLKYKLNLDISPNEGFLYSKSDVKSRRTVLGAHTSYWSTAKRFSKAVVKAYEDGYNLYNNQK